MKLRILFPESTLDLFIKLPLFEPDNRLQKESDILQDDPPNGPQMRRAYYVSVQKNVFSPRNSERCRLFDRSTIFPNAFRFCSTEYPAGFCRDALGEVLSSLFDGSSAVCELSIDRRGG